MNNLFNYVISERNEQLANIVADTKRAAKRLTLIIGLTIAREKNAREFEQNAAQNHTLQSIVDTHSVTQTALKACCE